MSFTRFLQRDPAFADEVGFTLTASSLFQIGADRRSGLQQLRGERSPRSGLALQLLVEADDLTRKSECPVVDVGELS